MRGCNKVAAEPAPGKAGKFRADGLPYLISDRLPVEFHRCLIAIGDGLQEPLAGERITAQPERTQRGGRRRANLDPTVSALTKSPLPTLPCAWCRPRSCMTRTHLGRRGSADIAARDSA